MNELQQTEASLGEEVLQQGGTMQQVRTSYATAVSVQRPRQLPLVERRLLEEARLAGESFYYGWTAGKDRIEGPSVDLALAAARCWGNCAVMPEPVQETPESWILTATFVDLETGFTYGRQFRQSKSWTVHGRMDEERKTDVRFAIGQSKAARNAVLKALPRWLIDKALEEAKAGVRAKIEKYIRENGHAAAVDLLMKSLAKCGVKEERVLAKCSVADRRALDLDHLVILRGDLYALENGQDTAETLFPIEGTSEGAAAATAATADAMRRKLAEAQEGKKRSRAQPEFKAEPPREPGVEPEEDKPSVK